MAPILPRWEESLEGAGEIQGGARVVAAPNWCGIAASTGVLVKPNWVTLLGRRSRDIMYVS